MEKTRRKSTHAMQDSVGRVENRERRCIHKMRKPVQRRRRKRGGLWEKNIFSWSVGKDVRKEERESFRERKFHCGV